MQDKCTDFPQYRKLSNNKVYYRINSLRQFDEIQLIGKSARFHTIEAQQYPEMLKIHEMLNLSLAGYESTSKEEFERLLNNNSL